MRMVEIGSLAFFGDRIQTSVRDVSTSPRWR
jgi:hypothetical protein